MSNSKHIVILGNGIAGITCARNLRKQSDSVKITVISGESKYFFSRTALMYVFMGHMKFEHTQPYENWFWEKNRIDLKEGWVEKVDFQGKELHFQSGEKLAYDQLVLATGSQPNKFGWAGQDLKGVQGLYSKQDLELMEQNTASGVKNAVIVGGGLIGIEMAEMLAYKGISVTFLVRETGFWRNILPEEESELVGRHIQDHHMNLKLQTELEEIISDESGRVRAIRTNKGEEIPCQFVGLTAGVTPRIDFLKNTELQTNRGILVDSFFKTNIPDVFAIGDCAEFHEPPAPGRNKIQQVWYTGRMHGETLAHNLLNEPVPYKPGVWFNSAKFLDIEYQTYGFVPSDWSDQDYNSFYWEHDSGKVSFRMLTNVENVLIGVNNFGFRLRHEFFDHAIREKWTGTRVIENLEQANFDPEFFAPYIRGIQGAYAKEKGLNLKLKKRSFIQKLFSAKL
ncbi:NAD(P)/FAD-dependent oxidoreductase [Algoriphagus kandeliae]|uniref:NAD(P)/FAD-dependent oxidoreductase n=1 Tax=Algoriphagus kandeliae TaxID=2562278 RepID=A0A4Y9QJH6_9BACT|nr:FAD/NAD(P)-binding oxidoreductase [Algoriphagus kandeliae]TFV92370.1 NAD(P)/FAD-dependent oxidoreductase [Algoriphagus kandeliae]